MRYRSPHADRGGTVPPALRGLNPMRTAAAIAAAGAIAFVPAVTLATPAFAATAVTVSNAQAVEGQDLTFTVTYSGSTPAVYNITTLDGTTPGAMAMSGSDFTALPATQLTFSAAGSQTVKVHTIDDSLYENTETFSLVATNANDNLDTASGTGSILDNDTAPTYTLSASPSPVPENVAGGNATITATLSAASGLDTTITVNTADGTAKAGTNYTAVTNGTILVPAGSLTGTTTVAITNDMVHDAVSPMTFTVNGIGDNVTNKSQSATVSITDVTPLPKVSISSPGVTAEGATANWTVTADNQSTQPITVNWDAVPTTPAAGHNAATPGDDFTYPSTGRTVTIQPGTSTATIAIPIIHDNLSELSEDYTIAISNPVNAALGTPTQATGTITDSDVAPTVAITPTTVTQNASGKQTQTFTATLSAKSGRTVTVDWNTLADSAKAGYDYANASGELVFPAGTTTQTFTVDILGSNIYHATPADFYIHLATPLSENPTPSATIGTPNTTITLNNSATQPTITYGDMSVKEGDDTWAALMPIKLSNPTDQDVTVTLTPSITGLTAPASDTYDPNVVGTGDYSLLTPSVTIPAGRTTGYAVVQVNGDTIYEPDESVNFGWSATPVASPTTGTAKFTILNDDQPPNVEINSVKGNEGDAVDVTATVTGMSQDWAQGTLWFTGQSVHGSKAADNADFVNPGVIPFTLNAGTPPGTVIPVATLQLNKDSESEPDETILVSGTGLGNQVTVTDGVVTIRGNGPTPPPATAPTIMAPSWVTGAVAVPITGKATAGATVELWGAPWSTASANPTKLATTTAGSDGSYKFSRWIGTGYVFQTAVGDQKSNVVKVGIKEAPVFAASSPSTGKLSLAVQGNPRGPKQTVIVQAWVGGKWVNTWKGMTGTNDLWKATVSQKSKSSWTLRAFVQGNMNVGINGGYSAAKKVTIK